MSHRLENPPEAGILPEAVVKTLDSDYLDNHAERRASASAASTSSSASPAFTANGAGLLYPPAERSQIRDSWRHLMRWSRAWRTAGDNGANVISRVEKVQKATAVLSVLAEGDIICWLCRISCHNLAEATPFVDCDRSSCLNW